MSTVHENEDKRTNLERARDVVRQRNDERRRALATLSRQIRTLHRRPSNEARERVTRAVQVLIGVEFAVWVAQNQVCDAADLDNFPELVACVERAKAELSEARWKRNQPAETERQAVPTDDPRWLHAGDREAWERGELARRIAERKAGRAA